ncbi:MAG: glycosyl transferase [Pseudobdellovibrio sp.]|jgi:cellulose synthase/poly-beta-1,6-N-acetylglucosamine synthase-like glycosyltransferase|nr:glycosyl transferase [Pseudobdellovibrio sp.]
MGNWAAYSQKFNEFGSWFFETHAIGWIRGISYYFIAVNVFYIFLLLLAVFAIRKRRTLIPFRHQLDTLASSPSISILAPAYNEQLSIEASVQALCHLRYANYEVIVINDGSKDNTLEKAIQKFQLYEVTLPRWSELSQMKLRTSYKSRVFPHLVVLDKENSGKADSLNMGIDFASTELVCCVDSDSLLEPHALSLITAPFLEDPSTVAVGGTVRVVNGNSVEHARVMSRKFPDDLLSRIQFLEYIRAFFCGRIGWNSLNATLIISGAFGAFKKTAVVAIGGYQTDTLGEDMDLVVRLHAHYIKAKEAYRIIFLPEPVCWTEVPGDWATLKKQRQRWTIGLYQVLMKSRRMIFNPRYGTIGMLALPYFLLVDLLSPFLEYLAIFLILWGSVFGYFTHMDEVLLFFISIAYGSVVTFAGTMIDDSYSEDFEVYPNLLLIFLYTLIENFGYRQIHAWWRIKAFFKALKREEHRWGAMTRAGIKSTAK